VMVVPPPVLLLQAFRALRIVSFQTQPIPLLGQGLRRCPSLLFQESIMPERFVQLLFTYILAC